MQEKKFLEKVACELLTTYKETLSSSLILVPNKRTRTFLFEYLRKNIEIPFLAPKCLSLEEYATYLSGLEREEQVPLLFQMYKSYEKVYKQKDFSPVSFEEFYFFGVTLLNDFDELDKYDVDVYQLFLHLKKLQPYEKGAPTIAKEFSRLWDALIPIYEDFTHACLEKKKAYPGLIYRQAAKKVKQELHPFQANFTFFFWVGFHALSPCEEGLFLSTKEKNCVFLDMDEYFTQDENQEAGFFFRNFWKKHLGEQVLWNDTLLSNKQSRRIEIFSTTNETTMVKLLGEKLKEKSSIETTSPDTVAIVLPKEELLFAVLNSLPPGVSAVNVTMGFPLRATQIATWIEALFLLRESRKKVEKNVSLSGNAFLNVLDHQYTRLLIENEIINNLIALVREKNMERVFQSLVDPHIFIENNDFLREIFVWCWEENISGEEALDILFSLTKGVLNAHRKQGITVEGEFIYTVLQLIYEIKQLTERYGLSLSFGAVARIFRDALKQQTVAFRGEPLEGWQIMGMLETQTLDFDYVYILSMNEGIMPQIPKVHSFIPSDIRKAYHLPQLFETEAVYAYHFYRLLKRAKEVYLFYTKETRETGLQEKSRYLEQILFEYLSPQMNTIEKVYTYPFFLSSKRVITYPKTEDIKTKLRLLPYSASALKTYFSCSLRFYYQYILGVGETKTLEEEPDAAIRGTIIHTVLEDFLRTYEETGSLIQKSDLESTKKRLDQLIEKAIQTEFSYQPVVGKLAFFRLFIKKQLEQILDQEEFFLQRRIKELETEFQGNFSLSTGENLQLKSRIDRLDENEGDLFLIDYKTGKKEALSLPSMKNEQNMTVLDDVFLKTLYKNKKRTHLFQLFFYSYLIKNANMRRKKNKTEEMNPYCGKSVFPMICYVNEGIFSFVGMRNHQERVAFEGEVESLFISGLEEAFQIILSEEPFVQTDDDKQCLFCSFQQICGRRGDS